jgi:hypothetical protein
MLKIVFSLLLLAGGLMAADPAAQFREHLIAQDLRGAYQVVVADLNHDGRPDLIGLASNMEELVWFENPGWERHVLARGLTQPINVAAWDVDGSGIPTLVLATGFSMEPTKSAGIVSVLRSRKDPRELWDIQEIDRLPASHRIRFADIDGSGKKVVVNAPLAGATAKSPDYRGNPPLVFYRPGVWKRELITDEIEGVLHGIFVVDWEGDGRDEILTASFQGIDLLKPASGGRWSRTKIAAGNPDPWPKGGSSDVAVGRLGARRFLCALEPWHGNQVVVYREGAKGWERTVIDDSLSNSHALLAVDLNGDGRDEIVAGYRAAGGKTYIYSADDPEGAHWTRSVLDSNMPAAACAAADLNGDGRPDLVCTGGSSLKWYENMVTARSSLPASGE